MQKRIINNTSNYSYEQFKTECLLFKNKFARLKAKENQIPQNIFVIDEQDIQENSFNFEIETGSNANNGTHTN